VCEIMAPHGDARAVATLALFAEAEDLRKKLGMVGDLAESYRVRLKIQEEFNVLAVKEREAVGRTTGAAP
jgi:hypothetical protein